jgi:hypothetical protein
VLMRARARADCCSGPRRQGCCNSEGMRRLPLLLLLLHDVVGEAHDGRATRFVQLVGVPPPNAASWVAAWLGVYREASHIPESIDGRRTYIKEEDPGKVLWHTSSGWWNVGHWHDVNTGAAMMAVKDAALTPDKVHAPWSVVTGSVPSHEIARGLACVPAFPFMLWLGGHAPKETGRSWLSRGWVANWFGTYVLSDESINGWPSYCRRTTKGGSGDPECGAQRMWFSPSTEEVEPQWVVGPSSRLGEAVGVLVAVGSRDGPHHPANTWQVSGTSPTLPAYRSNDDGGKVDEEETSARVPIWLREPVSAPEQPVVGGDWLRAPGLLCTSDEGERSSLGHHASMASSAMRARRADGGDDAVGERMESMWAASAAALDAVAEGWREAPPASELLEAVWRAMELEGVTRRLSALTGASEVLSKACVATCYTWVLMGVMALLFDRWRRRRVAASDDEELEASDASEPDSSEEKKLAFQCLSDAIEEVKGNLTEQQYMALYSAALWCFNLTPHWAEGRPTPPEPRDQSGGGGADTGDASISNTQHGDAGSTATGMHDGAAAMAAADPVVDGVEGGEGGAAGGAAYGTGGEEKKTRSRRRRRRSSGAASTVEGVLDEHT